MARWTRREIEDVAAERILVVDGAMGTAIQALDLKAADYGGAELEGCNENLVRTRPEAIAGIHRGYLDAGADIIETNTFGSTSIVLSEYGLAGDAFELNRLAAALARECADRSSGGKPRFVAGSMGPSTKAMSVTGGVTWDELVAAYREQALGLIDGGVDLLLLETAQDTRNVKASAVGILDAIRESGIDVPLMVSCTIELMGTMLAGQSIEAFATSVEHLPLFSVGLNCSTGPTFMTDHVRALAQQSESRITCVPNAGLPDENGSYHETPESMARVLARFAESGWINAIGGCCGTTPAHIRAFSAVAEAHAPRQASPVRQTRVSGIEFLALEDDGRPYLIGERTNVLGSRKFKRLIAQGKHEEAAEIGRAQVRNGAHVVDVCLQDPDRDELSDMRSFLSHLVRKTRAPLMIDSTDPDVIEEALRFCQGKAIINSVNLEDGEERFTRVVPIARRYGAALVCGTIDEDPVQGMGVTADRKLAIAQRSHALLTGKYGVPEEDIIWDPLVFPVGTGDATYMNAGWETIEGVRRLKEAFPQCKTVLGISNVSFGLPPAGRETLNSVFLYHCTKAGLDLAIVNSERLVRYSSIPESERALAERLLFENSEQAIQEFSDAFRDAQEATSSAPMEGLSLNERLARYIVDGSKDGLVDDLNLALAERSPLDVINGPLMAGMDEVGRLFNDKQLIVAEVLQSAEAMKAAVDHLEPFMEKSETSTKGTVILATVKGDVHDIGKNLVDIILSNNGYRVVNLGIKVAPERLVEAYEEHRPDIIGLSGLLVKSAQMMVTSAEDLTTAGIEVPLLVGGAALSDRFTRSRIAPAYGKGIVAYAKDAMDGLRLANVIMDPKSREALRVDAPAAELADPKPSSEVAESVATIRTEVRRADVPPPPDYRRHVIEPDPDELFPFIDPQLLYGRDLGLRGSFRRQIDAGDPRARELQALIDEIRAASAREGWLRARAVYQFFPCVSRGSTIEILSPDHSRTVASFRFPRQPDGNRLCLADYVAPVDGGGTDNLCLFVTTAGEGVRERAEELKRAGKYLMSHALGSLAFEYAEAAAEWLHARVRAMWGFGDPRDMTMQQRFRTEYRGRRYSFGYPACPDLAEQKTLFSLLSPAEIGVALTETGMMDPEASVSALVFHHPDATYFDARAAADR
ncbi:methionine synthase [Candidatus Poribacteria bacterium]|nr:methionine synthase [Candidatus Poribacteria bacterium]